MINKLFFAMMFACLLIIAGQSACFASTVVLQWDPNTDSDLAGYKVYYQADSSTPPFQGTGAVQGPSPIDIGNNTTATISGLDPAHPYYFAVTAYNTSGVESAYSNIVSVPELVPPTVTAFTLPSTSSTLSVPITTFTATDNVGVTGYCVTLTNSSSGCTWSGTEPASVTFPSTGTQTAYAWAKDAAGNISTSLSSSVNITIDTTPPTISITAPADKSTVSGTTSVTVTANDNVGVTQVAFYLDGTTPLAATNVKPFNYNWDTTTASNGAHTLTAKAYDAAGNVGTSSNITITVSNAYTISASAGSGGTISPAGNAVVNYGGSQTFSITPATGYHVAGVTVDGSSVGAVTTYTFSSVTANHTIVANFAVNKTSPLSVSITAPANSATVNGTVSVTASASDNVGVSKVEFYVNNTLKHSVTSVPYSYNWITNKVSDGSYTLTAKAYDAAGNTGISSPVTVLVKNDTKPPTVTITSPLNNATVSRTKTVTAKASDNVGVKKVEFYVDGELQATDTASPWSFIWNTASQTNGAHTLSAWAYDASGNVGKSSTVSVTVFNDTTAPTVSISSLTPSVTSIVGDAPGGVIVKGKVTITGTASDDYKLSKVEFYINNKLKKTISSDNLSENFSYTWNTTGVSDGPYTLTAKAIDSFGNETLSSVNVSVKNDTKAPTVSIVSPIDNVTVGGIKTVTAKASDNVGVKKVEFYVDGVLQTTDTTSPWSFKWNTASLTNGVHTLSAWAYDASGNMGQSSTISVSVFN